MGGSNHRVQKQDCPEFQRHVLSFSRIGYLINQSLYPFFCVLYKSFIIPDNGSPKPLPWSKEAIPLFLNTRIGTPAAMATRASVPNTAVSSFSGKIKIFALFTRSISLSLSGGAWNLNDGVLPSILWFSFISLNFCSLEAFSFPFEEISLKLKLICLEGSEPSLNEILLETCDVDKTANSKSRPEGFSFQWPLQECVVLLLVCSFLNWLQFGRNPMETQEHRFCFQLRYHGSLHGNLF